MLEAPEKILDPRMPLMVFYAISRKITKRDLAPNPYHSGSTYMIILAKRK